MKSDEVAVGDLDSAARGSGARKNGGKPQWWQLPVFGVADLLEEYAFSDASAANPGGIVSIHDVVAGMGRWQRMAVDRTESARQLSFTMAQLLVLLADEQNIRARGRAPMRALESTVRVLEFGAAKYKPGNWAKGMPWSVCFSCAISHLFAAAQGELLDQESGLSHLAHAMCNLVFLKSYELIYPEGDDRLTEWAVPVDTFQECRVDLPPSSYRSIFNGENI